MRFHAFWTATRFPYAISCFVVFVRFSCEIVYVVEGRRGGGGEREGSIHILENDMKICCRDLRVLG
jgi:hypothetical protein